MNENDIPDGWLFIFAYRDKDLRSQKYVVRLDKADDSVRCCGHTLNEAWCAAIAATREKTDD